MPLVFGLLGNIGYKCVGILFFSIEKVRFCQKSTVRLILGIVIFAGKGVRVSVFVEF